MKSREERRHKTDLRTDTQRAGTEGVSYDAHYANVDSEVQRGWSLPEIIKLVNAG